MSAARRVLMDSTRQVLWITTGAILFLVVIASAVLTVVSRELRAARESHAQAVHARETVEEVRVVLTELLNAETGERGYLLTGSEDFLEPYYAAERSLPDEITELQRLTTDPESRRIAIELAEAAHTQLAFLRSVVETRRTSGQVTAIEMIRTGVGRRQMDRIRELAAALEAREKSLLAERLGSFRTQFARSERTIQVSLSAAILLTLLAGVLLVRHSQRRLHAEDTAREASQLLRATMDSVTQGIAVFDSEQRLVGWNKRFVELRGLPPQGMHHGMSMDEISRAGGVLGPSKPETWDPQGRYSAIAEGRPFDVEAAHPDGSILQVRGQPMPDGNYIVTYTDVTALKQSELAHREQAARLNSILDNVVDGIVTINESGSIESWNRGAEVLFGYKTEEILRRNVRVLMPQPHSSAHDGYIRRYLQTGERRIIGSRREVEALHKDGQRIPVDLSIGEMRIGARRLFTGVVRDISARQEIEQLKSGFVSTVSHELRTPLTSISGSLGLLAGGVAGSLPAKATRLIDIAKLNCERLVRLINDILDLERAESGRLELRLEAQPIKSIVQQAIDANRGYAHNFGVTIELDAASADASVLVDRDRLIQVLTNVLSNAAKFSPRGSAVLVSINADDDRVRVAVRDQGPGIEPDFQGRIFQRFAQADSSDSRAKSGTGLGLSIAKTIMERLGGSIGFESATGRGTTFHVTLPIRLDSTMPEDRAVDATDGPVVLICEDDPDIAELLAEILRRDGLRSRTVASARQAWSVLDEQRCDVAVVDLHLQDTDGLEFISELRSRESTRSLPVIVITARLRTESDGGAVGALRLGDWLQKPIDPRRLLDSIHNVLVQPRKQRARILHIEDDESLTQLVNELLQEEADVVPAHSVAQARALVGHGDYDLVILDIGLGDGSGLDVLPLLNRNGRTAPPVIIYSATEPSRELSSLVQGALVKSRDSVEELLATVRSLAKRPALQGTD
jgi:PAS domain S-box-containing protein